MKILKLYVEGYENLLLDINAIEYNHDMAVISKIAKLNV
jgi:hypothetical protein